MHGSNGIMATDKQGKSAHLPQDLKRHKPWMVLTTFRGGRGQLPQPHCPYFHRPCGMDEEGNYYYERRPLSLRVMSSEIMGEMSGFTSFISGHYPITSMHGLRTHDVQNHTPSMPCSLSIMNHLEYDFEHYGFVVRAWK